MKLIEALKQIKDLEKKADDLREKVAKNSAHLNIETPTYADQRKQVKQWIQSHADILKEILRLRIAIQKTNLATDVVIELEGKAVTKSIAEWIHRRRDLANDEVKAWRGLTDRNLKEGTMKQSNDQPVEVKIVRCYEPEERDQKIYNLESEPSIIDGKLEIVNAVTDLLE